MELGMELNGLLAPSAMVGPNHTDGRQIEQQCQMQCRQLQNDKRAKRATEMNKTKESCWGGTVEADDISHV